MQLSSSNIADSGRLKRMVRSIVLAYDDTEISAIGINAALDFTYHSLEDSHLLAQYFCRFDNLGEFFERPKLSSLKFESQNEATVDTPQKIITISGIGQSAFPKLNQRGEVVGENIIPVCNININNHFVVSTKDEVLVALEQTEVLHAEFREIYQRMFSRL